MRLQRQAPSRGNLNAGLDSLTAIGAQLPGGTLLDEIAPVGEQLRASVHNPVVKTDLGLVVLASGIKCFNPRSCAGVYSLDRGVILSNRYACLGNFGASITSP